MTCKLAKKPIGQNLAVFSYYTSAGKNCKLEKTVDKRKK